MWEIDWLKESFSALLHFSGKKIKKISFVSDGYFRESNLNFFFFFIASVKSNYGEIFLFPNMLKYDDINICTKLLIREQKIINNCPSDTLTLSHRTLF